VFGHPYLETPNLDRLAAGGTCLRQFYVASPVCSPSRAAFIGGLAPQTALEHRRRLDVLAARAEAVDPPCEVWPGVRCIRAYGHTPGHLAVVAAGRRQTLLCIADAVLVPEQWRYPDWADAKGGVGECRRDLAEMALSRDMLVCGSHFPWPGIGTLQRLGAGYAWTPLHGLGGAAVDPPAMPTAPLPP
jgi:glyoxylase-like metal-dependent hydrolase (beta-lactamase superfamily II)